MQAKNEKYLTRFTAEELELISIDAQNSGKSPDHVMRHMFAKAERMNKQPGAAMPDVEPEAPPAQPTFQTGSKAASVGAEPQHKEDKPLVSATAEVQKDIEEKAKRIEESRQVDGRTSRAGETKTGRAKRGKDRVPLHMRNRVVADKRPGFMRRFFNDVPGRIQAALDAGWDFVYKDGTEVTGDHSGTQEGGDLGSRVSKPGGGGIVMYLMEIPEELYREDQLAKQRLVDASESDMLPSESATNTDSFYTKNEGGRAIQIKRE